MENVKKYGMIFLKIIAAFGIAFIAIAVTDILDGSPFIQGWVGGSFLTLMIFYFGIMKT